MKTKFFVFTALSAATMLSAAQMDQGRNTYQFQQNQQDPNFKQTPHTIMDDEIAKYIHDILASNWLSKGYPNVTFDVNNGVVTFRGVVDTQDEKVKIEQSAKKIEGVKGVRNDISVGLPKSPVAMNSTMKNTSGSTVTKTTATTTGDSASTDKDRIINTKLRERFERMAPLGYETIVLATSNGVVTITGNLERVEDMQKISTEARHVDGVKSVTNKLTAKTHH
ncbi:MAG TPA: BON domain-containing protein [Parachlamydiaceae bacterium]|nr:BON domain-containing protein [Parachlamydiaceae bacterium]